MCLCLRGRVQGHLCEGQSTGKFVCVFEGQSTRKSVYVCVRGRLDQSTQLRFANILGLTESSRA